MFLSAYPLFILLCQSHVRSVNAQSPAQLASDFELTTSTSLPFPASTQATAPAVDFVRHKWNLNPHIRDGLADIAFVNDPFPSTSVSPPEPVLQVTYQNGTYTPDDALQLYSQWDTPDATTQFQTVLLTYEVAFPAGFDWVKGGKLPGLRGGPDVIGCDGGRQPNGTNCFSMRMMWRPDGEGEAYAYILTSNGICSNPNFICAPGHGESIQRGAFQFSSGQWNRITMLVRLNDLPQEENGNVQIYLNDVLVINQGGLIYRNSSTVSVQGFFLSTFFGGNTPAWATPVTTYSYFRNVYMWGSATTISPAVRRG